MSVPKVSSTDRTERRNLPRISILTPSLNAGAFVGAAVASVSDQFYPDLEHLVLDAGSEDGTLDILARRPEVEVVHSNDSSAHEGMNLGLDRATGDVIGFLNADDLYGDGVLAHVGAAFADDPDLEALSLGDLVFESASDEVRVFLRRTQIGCGLELPGLLFGVPAFNARFFRRSLFDRIGGFDQRLRIAADRDFLIRAALAGVRAGHLRGFEYFYRCHDGSPTLNPAQRNARAIAREHIEIAVKHLANETLAGPARRLLSHWHAYECAKLALSYAYAGSPGRAVKWVARASRYADRWPLAVFAARRRVLEIRQGQRLADSWTENAVGRREHGQDPVQRIQALDGLK